MTTPEPAGPIEAAAAHAADLARRRYYREIRIREQAERDAAVRGAGLRGNWVARALADAFLATTEWSHDDLRAAADAVVGPASWMAEVVADVQAAYSRPPVDRPRELGRFIARLPSYREHVRGAPGARPDASRLTVRRRLVVPVRIDRRPFRTPELNDVGALAAFLGLTIEELDWYADRRHLNRRAPDQRLEHYHYVWLNGRLIEAPKPRLKMLQRWLLEELLGPIPIHPAAHGFVPGRDPHSYARIHSGQRMVIRLDVTSFFAAITAARVYGLFRAAGFPEPVAHTLTGLCTTRTPDRIRGRAPERVPDRGYRLALLAAPHLPQGAPTSPALANLCAFRLDRRLSGLAETYRAQYARYADDLAFSGDLSNRSAAGLAERATAIVVAEGFRINQAKTRLRGRADQQRLAGLVVNQRPAVPRAEYDQLRALLFNARRTGLDEQNREGLADFRSHLIGRVAWVGRHHPTRAAKLAQMLDALS